METANAPPWSWLLMLTAKKKQTLLTTVNVTMMQCSNCFTLYPKICTHWSVHLLYPIIEIVIKTCVLLEYACGSIKKVGKKGSLLRHWLHFSHTIKTENVAQNAGNCIWEVINFKNFKEPRPSYGVCTHFFCSRPLSFKQPLTWNPTDNPGCIAPKTGKLKVYKDMTNKALKTQIG